MEPDEELCLCFHVTRRKVENYLRIEKPRAPAQLADCYGAGTGCGWCRPFLCKLYEASRSRGELDNKKLDVELPESTDYASGRGEHVREGGGTPPAGATPIE